jgi:ketosteroid isomerase-like protein
MSIVSEQNIELQRRVHAAFNARDIEAGLAYCDPSIEWHSMLAEVGAIYRGHDEMRRWNAELIAAWHEMRTEPNAYFDLGEHVVVSGTIHGRGQLSGAVVTMPFALVAKWRDGLCVYAKMHPDRDAAFRELGVTEDELEPIAP